MAMVAGRVCIPCCTWPQPWAEASSLRLLYLVPRLCTSAANSAIDYGLTTQGGTLMALAALPPLRSLFMIRPMRTFLGSLGHTERTSQESRVASMVPLPSQKRS
jgi:hypothetical protein